MKIGDSVSFMEDSELEYGIITNYVKGRASGKEYYVTYNHGGGGTWIEGSKLRLDY